MTISILLSLSASLAWSAPSPGVIEIEDGSKICDELLVPPRAEALSRRIDATPDREGIVAEVSRWLVEARGGGPGPG